MCDDDGPIPIENRSNTLIATPSASPALTAVVAFQLGQPVALLFLDSSVGLEA
ncbi:MAG: hypothetical protein ABR571_04385 [Jatrophihabitans sp.]|uniref:hypothetical protein n=1 Tax=Jatrophihabitans sp. TaxID=1932789 RepID=UPI0039166D4F